MNPYNRRANIQSSELTLSASALKARTILQLRQLNWTQEQDTATILNLIDSLNIARETDRNEHLYLDILMTYTTKHFINLETKNSFLNLLQLYRVILPRRAQINYLNVFANDSEEKVLDSDEESEHEFELDAENNVDTLSVNDERFEFLVEIQDELQAISQNINIGISPSAEISDNTQPTSERHPAEHIGLDAMFANKAPDKKSSSPVAYIDSPMMTLSNGVSFPKNAKRHHIDYKHTALGVGIILGIVAMAVIVAVAPPVIPFIATALFAAVSAKAATVLALGTLATACIAVTAFVGALVDYALHKKLVKETFRRVAQSIKQDESLSAEIRHETTVRPVVRPAQQAEVWMKKAMDTQVSQATQTLFHQQRTEATVSQVVATTLRYRR